MLNVNSTLLAGGNYKGSSNWNKLATSLDQCFKLYYVTQGEALIFSNNDRFSLSAGNSYFINGFCIKNQCCPDSFEVNWLHYIPDSIFLKQFLRKMPAVIKLSPEILPFYELVFQSFTDFFKSNSNLKRAIDQKYFSTYLEIQSMLSSVEACLVRKAGGNIFDHENTETRLWPAIEYINKHYKESISLKKLAGLCYWSENYFHSLFKKTFGSTPFHYILQLKMNEAIRLLSYSNLTVKEIARETAYNDVAYFTRAFSKYFDISPGRFRKSFEKRVP